MDADTFTAFIGPVRTASGTREELTRALAGRGAHPEGLLVFSDRSGRETDLDLSGQPAPARRGRPRLGVTAREVTLLPRHWDWLRRQRGGASPALRRLVDAAIAQEDPTGPNPDAAYHFLTAIAGNRPGYEAAIRALYAGDAAGLEAATAGWPDDIRTHALTLARLP